MGTTVTVGDALRVNGSDAGLARIRTVVPLVRVPATSAQCQAAAQGVTLGGVAAFGVSR